jgi:hypothetical protein
MTCQLQALFIHLVTASEPYRDVYLKKLISILRGRHHTESDIQNDEKLIGLMRAV